jgi:hypothetical protein
VHVWVCPCVTIVSLLLYDLLNILQTYGLSPVWLRLRLARWPLWQDDQLDNCYSVSHKCMASLRSWCDDVQLNPNSEQKPYCMYMVSPQYDTAEVLETGTGTVLYCMLHTCHCCWSFLWAVNFTSHTTFHITHSTARVFLYTHHPTVSATETTADVMPHIPSTSSSSTFSF